MLVLVQNPNETSSPTPFAHVQSRVRVHSALRAFSAATGAERSYRADALGPGPMLFGFDLASTLPCTCGNTIGVGKRFRQRLHLTHIACNPTHTACDRTHSALPLAEHAAPSGDFSCQDPTAARGSNELPTRGAAVEVACRLRGEAHSTKLPRSG